MATIERYDTQSGRRYMVRYRKPDHKQTMKRGFRTKRDAEAFAATVEVQKLTGDYIAPALGRITVDELAPDWLARKEADLKASSYKPVERAWYNHVKPTWGHKQIVDINLNDVETWIADMGRTHTADDGTVTKKGSGASVTLRAYGILAGILDAAVKARRLRVNPARTPENLPRKKPKPRTYLTHTQVEQLAAEAKYPTLVRLLAYTGLRWGEAIGLRVKDLDLPRKRITVVENAVQVDQKTIVGSPKNDDGRQIAIAEFLVFDLRGQIDGKRPDDLVFGDTDGGYLKRSVSRSGWFEGAVERSGVPRVTVHDLRHTAASLAISAGVNVKALQRMLGHSSAAMTLDTYADLFDDDLDAVGVALDHARSQAGVFKTCSSVEQTSERDQRKTS
ncbi:site-specific integrase [Gordonia sihwensis]|uniref:tyrosine-type recombinase/integrase n=1 Tax=Gordonia sihwensis TaxID=173559 RepID=UPI001C92CC41|nr:tyrosine-type recombinase/integrase [Gordonia sihwensis]MBY4570390.1 site-specific integrase [Gordonia sihwensis]